MDIYIYNSRDDLGETQESGLRFSAAPRYMRDRRSDSGHEGGSVSGTDVSRPWAREDWKWEFSQDVPREA